MEPVFVVEPGCVELPRQAGLYKLAAAYTAQQQQQQQQQRGRAAPGPLLAPLDIGPFLLLPAAPCRLVKGSASNQQQQQQQQQQQGAAPSPLAAVTLESLGIASTGEFALYAVATRAGGGSDKQLPELLLARYHVENLRRRATLATQREQLHGRVSSLASALRGAQQRLEQQQQQRDLLQHQLGEQLQPAPQDRINHLLGNSSALVQQLIEAGDALAPLVTLGAAECPDVARALAGFVGQRDLATLVAATPAGAHALRQARVQCFNLSQNEAVQYFNYAPHLHDPNQQRRQASLQHALQHAGRAAWMIQHPQQLVPPSRDLAALLQGVLRWEGYHPQEGFVGFGINLLRLSSEQLRFSVAVRGTPNNNNGERLRFAPNAPPLRLGLRHTMWAKALSNLLLFESEVAIQSFRERLGAAGRALPGWVKLIALDGSTFNMRAMMEGVALGMPGPGSLVFGGVGQEEALPSRPAALAAAAAAAAGPLDLRLRHAMGLAQQLQNAQQEQEQRQGEQQQRQRELRQAQAAVAAAEEALAAAQQQQADELPQLQDSMRRVDAELQE
ncbi:hypothetical protein OEZ86_014722 [Tetradesmus obliquus]|nr:hypothetical protein OEZ86_014722 [Tetradesmus obliquus]